MPKFAGEVLIDHAALERFLTTPTGPVGEYLADKGRQVYTVARNMAPISPRGSHGRGPGYLRTQIAWELLLGADGLFVSVTSPARTNDNRRAPYGAYQNVPDLRGRGGHRIRTTPHLEPALRYVFETL